MRRFMRKERLLSALVLLVRLSVGCLFLLSSLPKIRQPYGFLANVYSYELVGPRLGMLVAIALPWVELIAGICLVAGIFVSGALLVSIAMAAMFTFVLASALYHGLQISCGCLKIAGGETISYTTLGRAIAILLLSISAYGGVLLLQPPSKGEQGRFVKLIT